MRKIRCGLRCSRWELCSREKSVKLTYQKMWKKVQWTKWGRSESRPNRRMPRALIYHVLKSIIAAFACNTSYASVESRVFAMLLQPASHVWSRRNHNCWMPRHHFRATIPDFAS
jgi:hypothetical protein